MIYIVVFERILIIDHFLLGTLKFIAKDWTVVAGSKFKRVHLGDYLIISCATNDPNAQLILLRSRSQLGDFTDAKLYFKERMIQRNYQFTLFINSTFDGSYYKCLARNASGYDKKAMELGALQISSSKSLG